MNKQEFLTALQNGLSGLPQEDRERSVEFYGEMIDDRIEDGLTEEEATAAVGSVNDIVSQILSEIPLARLVKAKVKPNHTLKAWEFLLLFLGSPLWLPLLFAGICVALAAYLVLWSFIIMLYAVDLTFAVCGLAGILGGLAYITSGNTAGTALSTGAGLICIGLAVFLFFGSNQAAKGVLLLSKHMMISVKSLFIEKENRK